MTAASSPQTENLAGKRALVSLLGPKTCLRSAAVMAAR